MSTPKIEEVYRCPECDEAFSSPPEATYHCVNPEGVPREYRCLNCDFVWPTAEQAIRCFDIEKAEYEAKNPWYELPPDTVNGI